MGVSVYGSWLLLGDGRCFLASENVLNGHSRFAFVLFADEKLGLLNMEPDVEEAVEEAVEDAVG